MQSINRLSSKYKTYSKSLHKFKEGFLPLKLVNKWLGLPEVSRKCAEDVCYNKFIKKLPISRNFLQKFSYSLASIRSDNVSNCKEVSSRSSNLSPELQSRLKDFYENKYIKRWAKRSAVFSAAGVVAAENVSDGLPDAPLAKIVETNVLQTADVSGSAILDPIPEPPPIPDVDVLSQVNALGEPTFASLGLGGWTPVGMVQQCFEFLHITLGVPWWEAIVIGTFFIRICMFPLVVIAQRNAAKMNNYLPQIQAIQLRMTEARQMGNQLEVARYSQELMLFMKEKNVNPFKNMLVPLAQMPVFISFFMGLRQMANTPVESLRDGGLFWFTDLTVPDQFFALPIITSFTLYATIELGTDSARLSSQNLQTMKYVFRALPFVILPFTVNFPGAILCYWVGSNFISLAQVGFLRIPKVRTYFKIDPLITHKPQDLPMKSKGFVGGIKDSWTNIKITKELEERRRLDEIQFQRAGKGPVVKTYKYDPTKHTNEKAAMSAKKR